MSNTPGPGQRTLFTKLVQCFFEAAPEVRAPPGCEVVEDRVELFDLRGRRPVRRAPSSRSGALPGCTIFFRKEISVGLL